VRVGISGTRQGATKDQVETLRDFFGSTRITRLTHGGCHGVDEQADAIYREVHPNPIVSVYPAIGGKGTYHEPEIIHNEMEPLKRNRLIVEDSDLMLIVPARPNEIRRSDTWATYRYSVQQGVINIVILPDGTTRIG
jgi:hypothetical protein